MSYNYLFFTNFNGSANFIYDFQNDTWINQDDADMSDVYRFQFSGIEIPYFVNQVFEAENCISDKKGIQVGTYEFHEETEQTFDVVFDNDQNSNSKGFKFTFKECMDYINQAPAGSYFEDYKGGYVSIISNLTGEIIISRTID